MADRIHFHRPDGSRQPANSGAPPILAAFGDEATSRLYRCGIGGALVTRWHNQPSSPTLQERMCAQVTAAQNQRAMVG
jgi:hypothetical protein